MTKIVGTAFKVINIFVVILYLLACLIPVLPAGEYWMISILGLIFPLLFVMIICFLLAWIIARSKWFMLSLLALIIGWQQSSVVAGININKQFTLSKPNQTLRVLSWNLSSWGETNKSQKTIPNYRFLTIELLIKQKADVLCFQEFYDMRYQNSKISYINIFKTLGYPYSYFIRSVVGERTLDMGVTIISKYPITDTAKFTYGEDDFAEHLIYADIQFNQQKVRIFTTHLQSVRFENDQYSTLRKIKRADERGFENSKTIIRKLKRAYLFRGNQADLVQKKISESPYPVVVCGDFNDVPNSYTYFTIKGNLQDAFLKRGTGFGRTFQYLSPTLRIDYILADKKFEVNQFNRIIAPYSDHYPIVADLTFK